MDRPLQLRISRSRIALVYTGCVLLLALFAVALADIPLWLQCLLVLVAGHQGYGATRALCYPSVGMLEWTGDSWQLHGRSGMTGAVLARDVFMAFGIISLPFALPSGSRLRVLLWPDSSSADSLRRLRRLLRQS